VLHRSLVCQKTRSMRKGATQVTGEYVEQWPWIARGRITEEP
jgi:hypothetical protein